MKGKSVIKRSLFGRVAAVVGAVALSMITLVAPANADPGNVEQTSGSLTLFKHKQDPDSAKRAPEGDPLQGVQFTAYQVTNVKGSSPTQPIDLTDKAVSDAIGDNDYQWANADSSVTIGGVSYDTTKVSTKTTDAAGKASWPDLPLGLYMVIEGNDINQPSNDIVQKAAPFLVAIPYYGTQQNADGTNINKWIYDVVVYPKNATGSIHKQISNGGSTLGKGVEFTISVPIPYLPEGTKFTEFSISDILDSRLSYIADSASVTINEPGSDQESFGAVIDTLSAGADYTLSTQPSQEQETSGRTVVKATINNADVTLKTQQGKVLVLRFKVDTNGVGDILNSSFVSINGHKVDSNEVTTAWGQLKLLKNDNTEQVNALQGAQFELWRSNTAGATTATKLNKNSDERVKLSAGNVAAAAQVSAEGNLVTDAQGTAVVKVLKPGIYYLVETKAPNGYVLDPTPHPVQVVSGEVNQAGQVNFLTVGNTPRRGPKLPLTGADGQNLLAAGGVAVLVLMAGGTVLVNSNRRKH